MNKMFSKVEGITDGIGEVVVFPIQDYDCRRKRVTSLYMQIGWMLENKTLDLGGCHRRRFGKESLVQKEVKI